MLLVPTVYVLGPLQLRSPESAQPKNANGGAENRIVLLTRKHLLINGFSPGRSIAERWDWSDAESLAPFRFPPFPLLGSTVPVPLRCTSTGAF
jgi:hypothetical protein